MLTADEPYPHPIRTWLAHHHTHSNFLTCITLFVALATGDHLYWTIIVFLSFEFWHITIKAEIDHDAYHLCERCATKRPIDASVEVAQKRVLLRTFHRKHSAGSGHA